MFGWRSKNRDLREPTEKELLLSGLLKPRSGSLGMYMPAPKPAESCVFCGCTRTIWISSPRSPCTNDGPRALSLLRFSKTGDHNIEDAYARHFVSPRKGSFGSGVKDALVDPTGSHMTGVQHATRD
jgi:hypothetical protein